MSRVANKAARLNEMELLLVDCPEGMNQTELARRLGVDRSTISRNLWDIEAPDALRAAAPQYGWVVEEER